MVYIIAIFGIILGIWGLFTWIKNSDPQSFAKIISWSGLTLAVIFAIAVFISKKYTLIWTIILPLVPWLLTNHRLSRLWNWLLKKDVASLRQKKGDDSPIIDADYQEVKAKGKKQGQMSRAEALLILGLNADADEEAILKAYAKKRQAILKLSPPDEEALELLQKALDSLL